MDKLQRKRGRPKKSTLNTCKRKIKITCYTCSLLNKKASNLSYGIKTSYDKNKLLVVFD